VTYRHEAVNFFSRTLWIPRRTALRILSGLQLMAGNAWLLIGGHVKKEKCSHYLLSGIDKT
jgi:hypothetical protein